MAKINEKIIEQELKRFDLHNVDEEVFGIGIHLDDNGRAQHSGLVLCYEGEKLFFHFTGEVELLDVTKDQVVLYFRKLELFPVDYFSYIRAHFDLLVDSIHPKYGYVFTDSFYEESIYVSDIKHLPDFCTCVGFCINIIRSLFIEKEKRYIEINDWDSQSLADVDAFFIKYVEHHLKKVKEFSAENIETIKKSTFKRITPVEIMISAYLAKPKKIPVRKKEIVPHVMSTVNIIQKKWIAED